MKKPLVGTRGQHASRTDALVNNVEVLHRGSVPHVQAMVIELFFSADARLRDERNHPTVLIIDATMLKVQQMLAEAQRDGSWAPVTNSPECVR